MFYANDTVNYVGYSDVTFWKDIISPLITINDPSNSEEFETTPDYNITIDEFNLYEYGILLTEEHIITL